MNKSAMEMSDVELDAFRIDNGINIEDFNRMKTSRWGRIYNRMKKGDSVHLDLEMDSKCLYHAMHIHGIKASRRRDGKGWRVWRLS